MQARAFRFGFAAAATLGIAMFAATASPPTATKLTAALKTSAGATKVPNLGATIPPLSALGNDSPKGINSNCYVTNASAVPSNAATLCAWGDLASTKVIYLLGDSQATMWLNAFIPVAKALGWKIVETAHTGCPPWPDQTATAENGQDDAQCLIWNASQFAFEQELKPQVVIGVGDGLHVGAGKYFTEKQMEKAQGDFVKDVAPAKVILLTPIPMYGSDLALTFSPAECLAAAKSLKSCDFSPKQLVEPYEFASALAVAKSMHEASVNVTPLFCTTKVCPAILDESGDRIVYLDSDHATAAYMVWISTAFESLIKSKL